MTTRKLQILKDQDDNTIISMKDVKYCKFQGHALSPLSCATPDTLQRQCDMIVLLILCWYISHVVLMVRHTNRFFINALTASTELLCAPLSQQQQQKKMACSLHRTQRCHFRLDSIRQFNTLQKKFRAMLLQQIQIICELNLQVIKQNVKCQYFFDTS